jgi:hypothetical protein
MSDLKPGDIVPDTDDLGAELNGRVDDDGKIACIRCIEMEDSPAVHFATVNEWDRHTDTAHRSRKNWKYGTHYQTFS